MLRRLMIGFGLATVVALAALGGLLWYGGGKIQTTAGTPASLTRLRAAGARPSPAMA
jgi:hypothetical protein